jgi:hypothetical protein
MRRLLTGCRAIFGLARRMTAALGLGCTFDRDNTMSLLLVIIGLVSTLLAIDLATAPRHQGTP